MPGVMEEALARSDHLGFDARRESEAAGKLRGFGATMYGTMW